MEKGKSRFFLLIQEGNVDNLKRFFDQHVDISLNMLYLPIPKTNLNGGGALIRAVNTGRRPASRAIESAQHPQTPELFMGPLPHPPIYPELSWARWEEEHSKTGHSSRVLRK
jgi:hypothetical protein